MRAGVVAVGTLTTFGESLRRSLALQKRSQGWLARQLHVDRSTVSGWLSGRREPNLDMLRQIARVLVMSADDLLDLPPAPAPSGPTCDACGEALPRVPQQVTLEVLVELSPTGLPRSVALIEAHEVPPEFEADDMRRLARLSGGSG